MRHVPYVNYICACGELSSNKVSTFNKQKMCGTCKRNLNSRVTTEQITQKLQENGCEFISRGKEVDNSGRSRIIVTFICVCDKGTTKIPKQLQWDVINRGALCNICGNTRRGESNAKSYAENKDERIQEKQKTCMEKYGVSHPMQNDEIRQQMRETYITNNVAAKAQETCMEKYGFPFAMQNSDVQKKSMRNAFKCKPYIFSSERTIEYQGYELHAIKLLLAQGVAENEILVGDDISTCGSFLPFMYRKNSTEHRYFPDIFDCKNEIFIEVKSEHTLTIDPEKIQLKLECVRNEGYNIIIWVFDDKGTLLRTIE
jgi:hypothetical protein